MAQLTPCLNPARCGVKNHEIGSEAHNKCLSINLHTAGGGTTTGAFSVPTSGADTAPTLSDEALERINTGDAEDEDIEAMLSALKQNLDNAPGGFHLVYFGSGEGLDDEMVTDYLKGNTFEINSDMFTHYSDSGYMGERLESLAETHLADLGVEFDELDLDDKTAVYDLIEESDTGDWAEELAEQTPDQLMRYALTPNMSQALSEDAIGFAGEVTPEQFQAVVDARVKEIGDQLVDKGYLKEISEGTEGKLRELFGDAGYLSDGDNLDVLWYGDVREVGGDKVSGDGASVTSEGPVTLLLSNTSGNFSEVTIDEPVTLKLDSDHHARLDKAIDPRGYGSLTRATGGVDGSLYSASFSN